MEHWSFSVDFPYRYQLKVSDHLFEIKNALDILRLIFAGVAELADAPDSKSGDRKVVWVRVPPPVPRK